ncbi:MAG: endonuclease NucS [Candidatus Nanoarchaeia archaeon]|nr:endonuclease NucS [Candidatus Nanoarchaeia archaeon]
MRQGYIGITDPNWYIFNKNNNNNEVIFWRRASNPINLSTGMVLFFLVKGTNPRYIRGHGTVKMIGSDTVKNLWDKFGKKMGNDSLFSIKSAIQKEKTEKIGYYLLDNVKYIKNGLDLNDFGIIFSSSTVSGKYIDNNETLKLLSGFDDKNKFKQINELPDSLKKEKIPFQKYEKGISTLREDNFESILEEKLDDIEEGLQLIKRQYSIPPVGRIDLFCKDKNGNLVVIELKKFDAKSYSVIDQVSRYMGFIKKNIAKDNQIVRGIIVVGAIDEKLKYAVSVIPNLEVKSFKINIV